MLSVLIVVLGACRAEQTAPADPQPGAPSSARAASTPAAAQKGLETLHQRYNAGDFGLIYESADPNLKGAATAEMVVTQLEQMHEDFGPWKSGTVVASGCHGNEVRLMLHSQFEKQPGTEYVVFRVSPNDGATTLVSFQVAPEYTEIPEQQEWQQCG